VISSSSKLVFDYDLAGDEIVSCGPDYIRLHAHHWANAIVIRLQACQTCTWCEQVRQNLVRIHFPLRFPWYKYARARTCARSRSEHRCKRSNNAVRSRIGIFHCSLTACFLPSGAQIFEKIYETPHESRLQTGDMKQVLY